MAYLDLLDVCKEQHKAPIGGMLSVGAIRVLWVCEHTHTHTLTVLAFARRVITMEVCS